MKMLDLPAYYKLCGLHYLYGSGFENNLFCLFNPNDTFLTEYEHDTVVLVR